MRGVGAGSKQTEAFSKNEEDQLWTTGVLGSDNPNSLLRAVFYLNGSNFCLRGGEEQRNLKISQLKRLQNPDRYVYTENASKNRTGGLKKMRVKNISVPIMAVPGAGTRCHVFILDTYLSKLSPEALEKDNFYVQPVPSFDVSKAWFTARPVGKNSLGRMVKEICVNAGISGCKTNHSLRATGVSYFKQRCRKRLLRRDLVIYLPMAYVNISEPQPNRKNMYLKSFLLDLRMFLFNNLAILFHNHLIHRLFIIFQVVV